MTEHKRCAAGSKTDNQCLREAVVARWGEPELILCAEHARVVDLADEELDAGASLELLEEYVAKAAYRDDLGNLQRLLTNARDEARSDYARVSAELRAASIVADGFDRAGSSPAHDLKLAQLMGKADSLANARTLIEDLPEESLGRYDRWLIVHALAVATGEASQEFERLKVSGVEAEERD